MSVALPAAAIGIGMGCDLVLDAGGFLHLTASGPKAKITVTFADHKSELSLALAHVPITKQRIDFIIECLERLKIHAA